MGDLTKKVLKHTTMVATAIGKATVKGTVWTAEQAWNHKEKIAGGVVGGAKGLYHFGQNVYGLTINKKDFAKLLATLRAQSQEYVRLTDEIGKRFSKREIMLDSLGIGTSFLHSYAFTGKIPDEVLRAYELAYPLKSQSEGLEDIIENYDDAELTGIVNGIKGKLFELRYVDYLNDGHIPDGYQAILAESATNPGWNIAVLGADDSVAEEIQLKATDSVSYVKAALERYPEINVATTEEVYNSLAMQGITDNLVNSGISNEELEQVVYEALESNSLDMDWSLPVIPMLIIGYSVYKKDNLTSFQKGSEFADRYVQSYIAYIAGGAAAVVTNTWLIGLLASIGTKVFCKYGQSNALKVKSLKDTIETNKKILQRMKKKLQSC